MEASASASVAMDLITDSGCSTPYMTAPSSPPPFFSQFDHNPSLKDANFTLPPPSSSPKRFSNDHHPNVDFAFHLTNKLFHDAPLTAEDLFHHGKIKPLRSLSLQTEELHNHHDDVVFKTANSSPRRKRKDIDLLPPSSDDDAEVRSTKREFNQSDKTPSFKARSLAPPEMLFHDRDDEEAKKQSNNTPPKATSTTSFWTSFSLSKAYRKWKLKDLLFRSASEGRSTDKVAVEMNYAVLTKCKSRDAAVSFRSSSDGSSSMKGSGSGSGRRRGVPVSAHELHYTVNRAVSEEMKRKTFLPYKQSLLGCLGFNPGGHQFQGRPGSMARV